MAEQPRRVRYFPGRLLTDEDLAAEQDYHRQMRYLVNRLHGHGIASGLDVDIANKEVRVSPGVAIDRLGRELVLVQPAFVTVGPVGSGGSRVCDLALAWNEDLEGVVPTPDGATQATWFVERPRLHLVPPDVVPDAVLLAHLKRTRRGVTVDLSVRRPLGPGTPE